MKRTSENGTSSPRRNRLLCGAALAMGSLLLLAQIAWACTAQPRIINLFPLSARPGEQISVSGQGVSPEVAPADAGTARQTGSVEIRWNGVGGPSLATVPIDAQGDFSARLVVPQAPPGIYTIVVAAGQSGIARAALEVVPASNPPSISQAAPARSASADLWDGFHTASADQAEPAQPVSRQSGWGLTAGIAMAMAGGAMALFGSLAILRSRRSSTGT